MKKYLFIFTAALLTACSSSTTPETSVRLYENCVDTGGVFIENYNCDCSGNIDNVFFDYQTGKCVNKQL